MTSQWAAIEQGVRTNAGSRPVVRVGYSRTIVLMMSSHALALGLFVAHPRALRAHADATWVGKRVVQKQRDFSLCGDAAKESVPQAVRPTLSRSAVASSRRSDWLSLTTQAKSTLGRDRWEVVR